VSAAQRPGGAKSAALVATVALVAVAAAVGFASHVPSSRSLPALNRGDPGNYTRNAIGRLKPVDAQFVTRRVGRVPGTKRTPTATPDTVPPRTTPPTTRPPRSIQGTPGAFPGLAPGGWELTLKMEPDRNEARSRDEIRYRMTITNVGRDDFRGRAFLLEWHTPVGTLGQNSLQQCSLVPLAIVQTICAMERLQISPGFGETRHERFDSSGLVVIPAGESWTHDWYVTVLPSNSAGSTIFNHAHLNVNLGREQVWLRTPDVVVKVVA
jgi:hypothetical protein